MTRLTWAASVALVALALVSSGAEPRALPLVYLAGVTPELWATDRREHRLPNALVLPGYLVAAVGAVGQWLVTGELPLVALLAGAGYFVFLLVFAVGGGMGMGDVKLAGVLGLTAGLAGTLEAVVSPVAAFLAGGAFALVTLARGRSTAIAFGPFLLAGFWFAIALGAVCGWTSPGGSST